MTDKEDPFEVLDRRRRDEDDRMKRAAEESRLSAFQEVADGMYHLVVSNIALQNYSAKNSVAVLDLLRDSLNARATEYLPRKGDQLSEWWKAEVEAAND
jgi:hypothetical protein